ncbi:unnamed protein product, partial [Porites lobata]
CEATGTSPVYVALMWNSIVLVNETDNAVTQLYLEGNYHCIATNNYGTDTRPFRLVCCGSVVNNTLKSPNYPMDYPKACAVLQSFHSIWHGLENSLQDFLLTW